MIFGRIAENLSKPTSIGIPDSNQGEEMMDLSHAEQMEVLERSKTIIVQLTPKRSMTLYDLFQRWANSPYVGKSIWDKRGTPEERFLRSMGMKPDDPNGATFPLGDADSLLGFVAHPCWYKRSALEQAGLLTPKEQTP